MGLFDNLVIRTKDAVGLGDQPKYVDANVPDGTTGSGDAIVIDPVLKPTINADTSLSAAAKGAILGPGVTKQQMINYYLAGEAGEASLRLLGVPVPASRPPAFIGVTTLSPALGALVHTSNTSSAVSTSGLPITVKVPSGLRLRWTIGEAEPNVSPTTTPTDPDCAALKIVLKSHTISIGADSSVTHIFTPSWVRIVDVGGDFAAAAVGAYRCFIRFETYSD